MSRKETSPTNSLHVSCLLAGFYLATCTTATAIAITAKVTSTFLLARHGYNNVDPAIAKQMGATLLLHCAGDLLIEVAPDPIVAAIPVFFLAHGFYSSILFQNSLSLDKISLPKKLAMGAFTLYGAAFSQFLMTKTDGIVQAAIPIYTTALTIMFLLACIQKQQPNGLMLAALMYVISDNLIGIRDILGFKAPYVSNTTHNIVSGTIWGLYYGGQLAAAKLHQKIHEAKKDAAPVLQG